MHSLGHSPGQSLSEEVESDRHLWRAAASQVSACVAVQCLVRSENYDMQSVARALTLDVPLEDYDGSTGALFKQDLYG